MNCVIITGGDLPDINIVKLYTSAAELVIGVDGAADVFIKYGIEPHVLIGDFDTADPDNVTELECRGAKVLRLQPEKNETDTEAAINYALSAGARDIVILGALGGRLDHALSNIMMLVRADSAGAKCTIVDNTCELFVSSNEFLLNGHAGQTISILPLTGEVCVNASGLKYPLNNLLLKWGSSRGVSNIMEHNTARINISGGYALIIKLIQ